MRYMQIAAIIITSSIINPLSAPEYNSFFKSYKPMNSIYSKQSVKNISTPLVSPTPAAYSPKGRWIEVIATGYSPNDRIDSNNILCKDDFTASMSRISRNPYAVAVPMRRDKYGNSNIPVIAQYGAKMYIPSGYGYLDNARISDRVFVCDDTGGVINKKTRRTGIPHIDLRFKTEDAARKFGKKKIEVFIYDE